MRGFLRYEKWHISELFPQHFIAERIVNDLTEYYEIHAHCLACAKIDILTEHGGEVDMRGWHNQGICGLLLKAMESIDEA